MSLKASLAKLLLLAVLEIGAIGGVPMTPEKIRRLLQLMNETKISHVIKNENRDRPGS